jgi:hypothetical protein
VGALIAGALVTGCDAPREGGEVTRNVATPPAEYRGIETRLLDGDLVQFVVGMGPTATPAQVEAYAQCAAAQYALIRGYGFARHVRTTVNETNGSLRGDAVYTISDALPRGLKTIDAEVVADNCAVNGIPMV